MKTTLLAVSFALVLSPGAFAESQFPCGDLAIQKAKSMSTGESVLDVVEPNDDHEFIARYMDPSDNESVVCGHNAMIYTAKTERGCEIVKVDVDETTCEDM